MGKKVIAGHICIDITPVFPDKMTSNIGDVLKPGKLIEMGKAKVSTGGAVANTGLGVNYPSPKGNGLVTAQSY